MPAIGQIISWPNYQFVDGSPRDKLLIVLNDSRGSNDLCLLLFTTSQEKWYPSFQDGCNPNKYCFHIPKSWNEPLRKPTFVKFPHILEVSCHQLWSKEAMGVRPLSRKLSPTCMQQIKECLLLFRTDISQRHYSLIFN